MKPVAGTWKPLGEAFASRALRRLQNPRTTTDGIEGDGDGRPPPGADKSGFNFGRHRWLGRVARDEKLPGAAHRTAVLLWELQNAERGCAWPSLTYLAAQLKMHKSTVIRSLDALRHRGWITTAHRGGRHRTNEYRISFGSMERD
jgi:Helix-turn-helix domain